MANKPYLDVYSGLLLEDREGGGGATGSPIHYTATTPIQILNHDIELKVDNQLLKVNHLGELTVDLNEIGGELTEKANSSLTNITEAGKEVIRSLIATKEKAGTVKIDNETIVLNEFGEISAVNATTEEKYGIKGDYSTRYGILDCPNGIIEIISDKRVKIKAGIVMQCAGQRPKTTIASDNVIDIDSNSNFVLFYACGALLECGDVFYQEQEPENGSSNYIAWFNPDIKTNPNQQWQFKSNDTGNIFRYTVATPIANFYLNEDGSCITRIDHIGYRILDDEVFALKSELPEQGQLMTGQPLTMPDIDINNINSLESLVPTINILLGLLRTRGVLA